MGYRQKLHMSAWHAIAVPHDTHHRAFRGGLQRPARLDISRLPVTLAGVTPHSVSRSAVSDDRFPEPGSASLRRDGASSSQTGRAAAEVRSAAVRAFGLAAPRIRHASPRRVSCINVSVGCDT